MGKYTINHICGHTEVVQLYGKMDDRERRIKYLETRECEDCQRAKANAAAAEAKEIRGLADLTGTPKQINWANTIRERTYKVLDSLQPFAQTPEAKRVLAAWKERMDAETSAKWWIDNRDDLPTDNRPAMARVNLSAFRTIFSKL